jgi:transketolase
MFVETLIQLAERDERIMLLTGDLGFGVVEPFMSKCPKRFINVGVAEQNMVGVATGLAESGFIPFVYSIAPFVVLRPYEFIRNGPILHRLPIRVVGIGGGFDYSHNGPSHYALEDIAVMRAQPGITVVAPADPLQARTAIEATWNIAGPVYYRLGRDDRVRVPDLDGRFDLGRAQLIRNGKDVLFISMGTVTTEVCSAADNLATQGIASSILVVSSVSPAPTEDLIEAISRFSTIITVEAHYKTGGLASLVSETIAYNGLNARILPCAVEQSVDGKTGSLEYLYERHGLSASCLVATVTRSLALSK